MKLKNSIYFCTTFQHKYLRFVWNFLKPLQSVYSFHIFRVVMIFCTMQVYIDKLRILGKFCKNQVNKKYIKNYLYFSKYNQKHA